MKIVLGIKARIFVVITILVIIISFSIGLLLKHLTERDRLISELTENHVSLTRLEELKSEFEESQRIFKYLLISHTENRNVFLTELKLLYEERIPSISNSLVLKSNDWVEEDRAVIIETVRLLTDSIYFDLIDFSSRAKYLSFSPDQSEGEINSFLANSGLLYLISKIEQNINFLLDKRMQEIASVDEEISSRTMELRNLIIFISLFSLIFLVFAITYLLNYLRKFISELAISLEALANGNIPENISINNRNEFSVVYANMNKLINYLRNLTLVAEKISKKDFSTTFKPLSKDDEPGNAIFNLQESLKKASEEEKKFKKEEEEQLWKSDSIAVINDILRKGTDNLEELGSVLCKEIVRLIDASVAGLFIVKRHDEPSISLLASHAYDRKKNLEREFGIGEGLIGRCVQEKETIYLTDIPENHLKIRTGLGESAPVSLLIVPLKLNDKVLGALEIASLYEIGDLKISFVEIIAENIATSIANLQAMSTRLTN
ncbi:MAG: GAF domain-containing protein [Bacteroidota bacterium]